MLAFLFVSLKVGEKLDTRRSRSSDPLRQDDDYIKIHSLVVGANFVSVPSSAIESTLYMSDVKQGMSMCQLKF
jgi:hypothetical protein